MNSSPISALPVSVALSSNDSLELLPPLQTIQQRDASLLSQQEAFFASNYRSFCLLRNRGILSEQAETFEEPELPPLSGERILLFHRFLHSPCEVIAPHGYFTIPIPSIADMLLTLKRSISTHRGNAKAIPFFSYALYLIGSCVQALYDTEYRDQVILGAAPNGISESPLPYPYSAFLPNDIDIRHQITPCSPENVILASEQLIFYLIRHYRAAQGSELSAEQAKTAILDNFFLSRHLEKGEDNNFSLQSLLIQGMTQGVVWRHKIDIVTAGKLDMQQLYTCDLSALLTEELLCASFLGSTPKLPLFNFSSKGRRALCHSAIDLYHIEEPAKVNIPGWGSYFNKLCKSGWSLRRDTELFAAKKLAELSCEQLHSWAIQTVHAHAGGSQQRAIVLLFHACRVLNNIGRNEAVTRCRQAIALLLTSSPVQYTATAQVATLLTASQLPFSAISAFIQLLGVVHLFQIDKQGVISSELTPHAGSFAAIRVVIDAHTYLLCFSPQQAICELCRLSHTPYATLLHDCYRTFCAEIKLAPTDCPYVSYKEARELQRAAVSLLFFFPLLALDLLHIFTFKELTIETVAFWVSLLPPCIHDPIWHEIQLRLTTLTTNFPPREQEALLLHIDKWMAGRCGDSGIDLQLWLDLLINSSCGPLRMGAVALWKIWESSDYFTASKTLDLFTKLCEGGHAAAAINFLESAQKYLSPHDYLSPFLSLCTSVTPFSTKTDLPTMIKIFFWAQQLLSQAIGSQQQQQLLQTFTLHFLPHTISTKPNPLTVKAIDSPDSAQNGSKKMQQMPPATAVSTPPQPGPADPVPPVSITTPPSGDPPASLLVAICLELSDEPTWEPSPRVAESMAYLLQPKSLHALMHYILDNKHWDAGIKLALWALPRQTLHFNEALQLLLAIYKRIRPEIGGQMLSQKNPLFSVALYAKAFNTLFEQSYTISHKFTALLQECMTWLIPALIRDPMTDKLAESLLYQARNIGIPLTILHQEYHRLELQRAIAYSDIPTAEAAIWALIDEAVDLVFIAEQGHEWLKMVCHRAKEDSQQAVMLWASAAAIMVQPLFCKTIQAHPELLIPHIFEVASAATSPTALSLLQQHASQLIALALDLVRLPGDNSAFKAPLVRLLLSQKAEKGPIKEKLKTLLPQIIVSWHSSFALDLLAIAIKWRLTLSYELLMQQKLLVAAFQALRDISPPVHRLRAISLLWDQHKKQPAAAFLAVALLPHVATNSDASLFGELLGQLLTYLKAPPAGTYIPLFWPELVRCLKQLCTRKLFAFIPPLLCCIQSHIPEALDIDNMATIHLSEKALQRHQQGIMTAFEQFYTILANLCHSSREKKYKEQMRECLGHAVAAAFVLAYDCNSLPLIKEPLTILILYIPHLMKGASIPTLEAARDKWRKKPCEKILQALCSSRNPKSAFYLLTVWADKQSLQCLSLPSWEIILNAINKSLSPHCQTAEITQLLAIVEGAIVALLEKKGLPTEIHSVVQLLCQLCSCKDGAHQVLHLVSTLEEELSLHHNRSHASNYIALFRQIFQALARQSPHFCLLWIERHTILPSYFDTASEEDKKDAICNVLQGAMTYIATTKNQFSATLWVKIIDFFNLLYVFLNSEACEPQELAVMIPLTELLVSSKDQEALINGATLLLLLLKQPINQNAQHENKLHNLIYKTFLEVEKHDGYEKNIKLMKILAALVDELFIRSWSIPHCSILVKKLFLYPHDEIAIRVLNGLANLIKKEVTIPSDSAGILECLEQIFSHMHRCSSMLLRSKVIHLLLHKEKTSFIPKNSFTHYWKNFYRSSTASIKSNIMPKEREYGEALDLLLFLLLQMDSIPTEEQDLFKTCLDILISAIVRLITPNYLQTIQSSLSDRYVKEILSSHQEAHLPMHLSLLLMRNLLSYKPSLEMSITYVCCFRIAFQRPEKCYKEQEMKIEEYIKILASCSLQHHNLQKCFFYCMRGICDLINLSCDLPINEVKKSIQELNKKLWAALPATPSKGSACNVLDKRPGLIYGGSVGGKLLVPSGEWKQSRQIVKNKMDKLNIIRKEMEDRNGSTPGVAKKERQQFPNLIKSQQLEQKNSLNLIKSQQLLERINKHTTPFLPVSLRLEYLELALKKYTCVLGREGALLSLVHELLGDLVQSNLIQNSFVEMGEHILEALLHPFAFFDANSFRAHIKAMYTIATIAYANKQLSANQAFSCFYFLTCTYSEPPPIALTSIPTSLSIPTLIGRLIDNLLSIEAPLTLHWALHLYHNAEDALSLCLPQWLPSQQKFSEMVKITKQPEIFNLQQFCFTHQYIVTILYMSLHQCIRETSQVIPLLHFYYLVMQKMERLINFIEATGLQGMEIMLTYLIGQMSLITDKFFAYRTAVEELQRLQPAEQTTAQGDYLLPSKEECIRIFLRLIQWGIRLRNNTAIFHLGSSEPHRMTYLLLVPAFLFAAYPKNEESTRLCQELEKWHSFILSLQKN